MESRPDPRGRNQSLTALVRDVLPVLWKLARPRVGPFALSLLLLMVSRAASLVLPASTKYLVDDAILKRNLNVLGPLMLAIVGAGVVHASSQWAATRLLTAEGLTLIKRVQCKIQNHVGRLPLSFYDANRCGTLARRIMDDAMGLRSLFGMNLIEFLSAILTGFYSLIFLLKISPTLTAAAVLCLAAFTTVPRQGFKRVNPIFADNLRIATEVMGRLTESLSGVRLVKGHNAEAHEALAFEAGVDRLHASSIRITRVTSLITAITVITIDCTTAALMYLAAREILAGTVSLGDVITFMAFLTFLTGPMARLAPLSTGLAEGLASFARVQELFSEKSEDDNPRRTYKMNRINGLVVLEDVCFTYGCGFDVLKHVSFDARAGMATALVGSSGSGKSTLLGLIAAFYEPSAGIIRIDGVNLSTARLDSYRSQLGFVLQDTFLFDGTIKDNVAFARPHASESEILAACTIGSVQQFAESFPRKYDTLVGERGVKLSMGQRQRISIARAVLADPRILILDEATSSLDSESEAAIQEGLTYLMKGRTTFIVAHRLSTIRHADQIIVLENGLVLERGTHDVLYAKRGRYYELSVRQHYSDTPAS